MGKILARQPELALLTCLAIALVSGPASAQDELNVMLKCDGSGTMSDTETTYTSSRDKETGNKQSGTQQSMVKRPFTGTVFVEIRGNMAQVKLPVGILPAFQKDDAADWFPVNKLAISDSEVTGRIHINGINKPKMELDRKTGSIVLAGGFSNFSGQCERFEQNAEPVF